jgi:pyruvate/2-oxoglutarate dehydrogenase complex dihydrolipoamide dehydrogenase (E3) component
MKHFDAIIIGTGQAGPSLAARFASAGKTVAIIERHKFGGTCVNTGCIPTKTMVASAYAVHVARRGAEYGFAASGDVRVDMKRVKARKDEVSGRSNRGVEDWLRGLKNCTVLQGHARLGSMMFHFSRTLRRWMWIFAEASCHRRRKLCWFGIWVFVVFNC